MLITVYTHGFTESQISELCQDMANYHDIKKSGKTGETQLLKILYKIEYFTASAENPTIKNIGYLYPIIKKIEKVIKPTFDYWEEKGVQDDT